MSKELNSICERIKSCKVCSENPQSAPLPHEPRPVLQVSGTARLCICGQAPGVRAHNSGLPFNDPSGDRLRDWLGIDREVFYDSKLLAIIPMGFCFPGLDRNGGDLPPRIECKLTWHDELFQTLPNLELIIAIGKYAHEFHLGSRRGRTVTETVIRWRDYWQNETHNGLRYLPLPHPSWRNSAWLKKNCWFNDEVLPVLKSEVVRLIG